jgi:hypothetical protein
MPAIPTRRGVVAAAVIGPTVIAIDPTTFIQVKDHVSCDGNQSGGQIAGQKMGP